MPSPPSRPIASLRTIRHLRIGIVSDAILVSDAIRQGLGVRGTATTFTNLQDGRTDDEISLAIVVAASPSAVREYGERARRAWPRARQVACAVPDQEKVLLECFARGMRGVVVAHEPLAALADALVVVHSGDLRVPPPTAHLDRLIRVEAKRGTYRGSPLVRITTRERQILDLVASGKQNKEIASDLGVELQTVKNQIFRLFRKLKVTNRADAARLAPPPATLCATVGSTARSRRTNDSNPRKPSPGVRHLAIDGALGLLDMRVARQSWRLPGVPHDRVAASRADGLLLSCPAVPA